MEGIQFVREEHFTIAEGCYLPRADLLGYINQNLHEISFRYPELKQYLPNLLDVDLFISWDEERFLLFVSPEKRGNLATRGIETKHLPSQREAGQDHFQNLSGFVDISEIDSVKQSFVQLGFAVGFAAAGTFPAGSYTEEAKVAKATAGKEVARLIQNWAQARRIDVENSCIFLSHKGINKPLVEKIDRALRLLNLKTWFDRDELPPKNSLPRVT